MLGYFHAALLTPAINVYGVVKDDKMGGGFRPRHLIHHCCPQHQMDGIGLNDLPSRSSISARVVLRAKIAATQP